MLVKAVDKFSEEAESPKLSENELAEIADQSFTGFNERSNLDVSYIS